MENTQQLNLQDLESVKSIIDVCTSRGAFKANELATVGAVYNKIDTFLTLVKQQAELEAQQAQQPATGQTPENTEPPQGEANA